MLNKANVLRVVVNVLQLNSNIRSLKMGISELNHLDSIKEHLQSIEHLDLFLDWNVYELPKMQNYSIYLQNVTKFKFRYGLLHTYILPTHNFLSRQSGTYR